MRFLLLLAASLSLSAAAVPAAAFGGWRPIKNVSKPHVQEIAKFAVNEHNKYSQKHLRLINVATGDTQIVGGVNYRLVINAAAGVPPGTVREYEALVWERSWENFLKLRWFKQLDPRSENNF